MLALLVKKAGKRKLKIPQELSLYAERMNLWGAAGIDSPAHVTRRDSAGRFLPVQPLRKHGDVERTATDLAHIARRQGAPAEDVRGLWTALVEILGNCFAHAEVEHDLHGLACAQAWPAGKLAQIAIADSGIGIRASLQGNPDLQERLKGVNSCDLATRYGITGKPKKGHSGYGLTLARELMEQNGGTLIVCSHREIFGSSRGRAINGHMTQPWPGTLVMLEWNTNRSLNVTRIYESWPLPEGYTDEDFNI